MGGRRREGRREGGREGGGVCVVVGRGGLDGDRKIAMGL
jgi:hypothetical protein